MLAIEESKIKMYGVVLTNLNNNKPIWEGTLHFVNKVETFSAIVEAFEDVVSVQEEDTTGFADQKKMNKIKLIESAMVVVLITRSYATIVGDRVLAAKLHYSEGKLKNLGATDLAFTANTIYDLATEYLDEAGTFGLTQGYLDDLLAKNAKFSKSITGPADQIKLKKEATIKLKKLFKDADTILKKNIDCDMIAFKKDHPIFYLQHFISRRIKNSPTIKLAMRIKIVDANTKEPIPKALVVIKDHKIKRKSSPKGALRIRNLSEGNHTVNVKMEGYAAQAVKATYSAGKTTMVTVELVKLES